MTKEVKKKFGCLLPEGSPFCDMNFTSDGLFWVKDMCEKIEVSCNNFVDKASEQFKKIVDEVSEWERKSDCYVPVHVSKLSSKMDHMRVFSHESKTDLNENSCNKKLSDCDRVKAIACISEDLSLAMVSNEHQILNQSGIHDENNTVCFPTVARESNCSDDSGENREEVSDTVTSPVVLASAIGHDRVLQTESHHRVGLLTAEESTPISKDLSLVTPPKVLNFGDSCDDDNEKSLSETEVLNSGDSCDDDNEKSLSTVAIEMSSSSADLRSSFRLDEVLPTESHHRAGTPTSHEKLSENQRYTEPEKLGAFGKLSGEVAGEVSNDREGIVFSSSEVVNHISETEEFEDVKLEESWDFAVKDEISLLSSRSSKKMSYKKKLSNMLLSKLRSQHGFNLVDNQHDGVTMQVEDSHTVTGSSGPNGDIRSMTSLTTDSIDSEWELL